MIRFDLTVVNFEPRNYCKVKKVSNSRAIGIIIEPLACSATIKERVQDALRVFPVHTTPDGAVAGDRRQKGNRFTAEWAPSTCWTRCCLAYFPNVGISEGLRDDIYSLLGEPFEDFV